MEDWKIVTKDGNPETAGVYDCILLHEEMRCLHPEKDILREDDYVKTGRTIAIRDSRYFGPAERVAGWIMKDQPNEGLVWSEESGSYSGEWVYAWLPARVYPDIELPEGVEWDSDE